MKKTILLTLGVAALLFVSVSCKKKCDIPEENTNSGSIIESVIYPSAGGLIVPNGLHIHSGSSQNAQNSYEVSLDGGFTVQSVDYSQYNILGYPLTVNCDVAIDREVLIDDLNQIVTFNVIVYDCENGCDQPRNIENYILVPAFDPNYAIVYNVEYK